MDSKSLKKYIYEKDKIEFVLESIGCQQIKYHASHNYYSCANYNGDNATAVNVSNNEYLNVKNWTRQKEFDNKADIFTLVGYNLNKSFRDSILYLHDILNLPYTMKTKKQEKQKTVFNPLALFEKVRYKKNDVKEIEVLSEDILNDYIPKLYIDWFKEGIMPWTRAKFGLAYSYQKRRIIIPIRYWLTGELIGYNSRTTVSEYAELGIAKYYTLESYSKSLNLYGLYENYESIQQNGYVVVVEAEKSVLKRDSLNDSTLVALSGHSLSDEQISILIGLNVDIIIAMDKDIPLDRVKDMCKNFKNIRNTYYVYDKWDLLNDKESPADLDNKQYQFLLDNKIRYC